MIHFSKNKTNGKYVYAREIEHVRPMFDVCWTAILASLSMLLEHCEDFQIIQLCLEGFEYGIHISSLFDMELPRDAFVSSLAKFTNLSNLNQMKSKHIECIKLMIKIALNEGNYLKSSWSRVLNCISKLERLQLIGSGVGAVDSNVLQESKIISAREKLAKKQQHIRKVSMDLRISSSSSTIEQLNSIYVIESIDPVLIDKIFSKSSELNDVKKKSKIIY